MATNHISGTIESMKDSAGTAHYINATYFDGKLYDEVKEDIQSGRLKLTSSDGKYYLTDGSVRYLISAPASRESDGTYKDVTILTTTNIADKGLFVPMTGTAGNPMTGDVQIRGEYEGYNASSGPIAGGSGSAKTAPRYSDACFGMKGISYRYYGSDSSYGGSDGSGVQMTYGFCYKPMDTSAGAYSPLEYTYLNAGLSVYSYNGQSNSGSLSASSLSFVNITPDGYLKYRSGSTTGSKKISNLVETGDLSGYQKTITKSTDVTMRTLSFKNGVNYSISGIYCAKVTLTVGASVGNEKSATFTVNSSFQSTYTNGTWYFVTTPVKGGWVNTICYGITGSTSGGTLWVKRVISASEETYTFDIMMIRQYNVN